MAKKIWLIILLLLASGPLKAKEGQNIPLLFGYQSILTDEGGNLIQNGPSNVVFRILDEKGSVLFEEYQSLEATDGRVSAIVGNGLSVGGGASAGIPQDVFTPNGARYLEVEVSGQTPYDRMEIVSSPYSIWADTALGLFDGALTGSMIGKGVIKKEHLDGEFLSSMGGEFQKPNGAEKIGVTNSFIYSGSQTVQGVLKDLDLAVRARHEEVSIAKKESNTAITNEATARASIDSGLQSSINGHKSATSAHGISGYVVGTTSTQRLENKTLVSPKIEGVMQGLSGSAANVMGYTRIKTGQYTGDGASTRQITGMGFRVRVAFLWCKELTTWQLAADTMMTEDPKVAGIWYNPGGMHPGMVGGDEHGGIHSFSSDGFTVYNDGSDDANANVSGKTYNYIALGESN